jgi:hypothetical protein
MEGGNELSAFLLLEILQACGLVRRFKPQPFELKLTVDGIAGIPDFMLEWHDGIQMVTEVKSSTYYTAAKEKVAERLAAFLGKHRLEYVVWTTAEHLQRALWHNVRQVHASHLFEPAAEQVERLAADLAKGPVPLNALIDRGFEQQTVLHQVWEGRAHFNLMNKRCGATLVYGGQAPELRSLYGGLRRATPNRQSLWDSLSDQ